MAQNPIEQQWQAIQDQVHSALKESFPIEGRRHKLVLHKLVVDEKLADQADLRSQEDAKVHGKTWGANVYGDISLVDIETGQEVDRSKIKLLTLPKPTKRYSFIVDGNEWQVDNLWRLRSGVYAHIRQNGMLEAEFNLATLFARSPRLYVPFEPEKKKFKLVELMYL